MAKEELFYMARYPVSTLKAIVLRAETEVLDDFARTNYRGIPLAKVVRAITENKPEKKREEHVVYFEWPESTHEKVKKGQVIRPGGSHPEHWDI